MSYTDLFDDAPCGCLVADEGGRILWTNATLAQWLQTPAADLCGQPVPAIFTMAGRVLLETALLPNLRLQGRAEEVSLDLKAAGGVNVPVLIGADTRSDPATRATLTRYVFMKAAARKTFERELIAARTVAETSLSREQQQGQLREQFVAVLGHDLRNPLASMSAATRMLSREPLSDQGVEVIRLMKGSVQRMSRLIDNVLDFARNRLGGGIELALSNAELEPQIRQAIDELRAAMPERELRTTIAIRHPVACDAGRIGQMVSNLAGNALIHGDPTQAVVIDCTTSDAGLELWVSNRGTPIAPDMMHKLFDPFQRNGAEGHREGLGLGLHIAAEIARAHGGTLDVVSTTDETRFTFRMAG